MDDHGQGSGENEGDDLSQWQTANELAALLSKHSRMEVMGPLLTAGSSTAYPDWSPTPMNLYSEERMDLLDSLLADRKWDAVDEYLTRVVAWHIFESKPAVENVPFGTIDQEHPELALMPRRKYVHNLIAEGKWVEANRYYADKVSVLETCGLERVRKEVSDVKEFIHSAGKNGRGDDIDAGLAIKDYIYLYYPSFRPPMMHKRQGGTNFSPLWEFAEKLESGFRCLACHTVFIGRRPNMIAPHLRGDSKQTKPCVAVTAALLKRLLQHACRKSTDREEQPPPDGGSGASGCAAAAPPNLGFVR